MRGLQVHGTPAAHATAGQRVAPNLTGVDVSGLDRGEALAAPGTLRPSQLADAFVELLPSARPSATARAYGFTRAPRRTGESLGDCAPA